MTIQDFNQALNESSSNHEAFAALRQAEVRARLDDSAEPTAPGGWLEWA